MTQNVPVPYDAEFQSPIPSIWRDCIIQMVEAFQDKDFGWCIKKYAEKKQIEF